MITLKHLKIIQTLYESGSLTNAANVLCLSQSALSHQIRYLEEKLGIALWEREGRGLRLTKAGELLLQTAQQLLPILSQTEKTLTAYAQGRQGVLRIGVECYPCYKWLTKVIGVFLQKMPDVEVEIINKFQFSGHEGLLNHHIDILITPDIEKQADIHTETLAQYNLVLLVANQHPLALKTTITPKDLINETLLTFPVPLERLDILTQFLNPAHIKPKHIKKIESIELMLQMTALERGVCVLPEWLADEFIETMSLQKIYIKHGLGQKLFAILRQQDKGISYVQHFISISKEIVNTA
ncbi:LysR family transcriptional regulator [Bathymodiolus thermophilus thioautotrophic gill symbiont]|uniref:LysR family transcriptional regulator n=1 Tax=Bathymodiolus thermophilus thioautotrophic gill symbiont TaxID=2360 RepID=A0A1J5TWA8_9GAMM|nr:LysR family transcriptional regulator [Bathymodiolus thermophilus thioautotrophic gill symbiont]OIR25128.1 LysR family transcriptional regulator [Bathymodiolus thermophilus thioautotrophic gill symbiont]